MQKRSDAKGLARLVGHLVAIGAIGALYALSLAHASPRVLQLLAAIAFGFTLVTMFAAMHEAVHRTAFRSPRLNDGVAWFAGLLSFYNSTFYRPYHGWHHRFTQLPGKDPELEDKKPVTWLDYLVQMSGIPWWFGKLRTPFPPRARKNRVLRLPHPEQRAARRPLGAPAACAVRGGNRRLGRARLSVFRRILAGAGRARTTVLTADLARRARRLQRGRQSSHEHAHHVHALSGALPDVGDAVPRRTPSLPCAAVLHVGPGSHSARPAFAPRGPPRLPRNAPAIPENPGQAGESRDRPHEPRGPRLRAPARSACTAVRCSRTHASSTKPTARWPPIARTWFCIPRHLARSTAISTG